MLAARSALAGRKIKNIADRDQFILDLKLKLVKLLFSKNIEANKVRAILNFIKFYIRFEIMDTNTIFEKELDILTKTTNVMGIEEQIIDLAEKRGKREGKKEGKKEGMIQGAFNAKKQIVNHLIVNLGYTEKQTAKLIQVPLGFVKKFSILVKR